MTQEELSAQEAAIDKAIGFLEAAEAIDAIDDDLYGLIDVGKGWAAVASAIVAHNKSVVAAVLSETAVKFVQSPDPDAYAELVVAAGQYVAER